MISATPLLLAYYGDDFTGSADVMEALARCGYPTALFLQPPTPRQLANYPGLRAFGIAGGSRTMPPEAMEQELPRAFEALKSSGARIAHYKVCSTFDSSPRIGSIGKAIELGRRIFGQRPTPLLVGLPWLGRYVVFGNLFARSGLDTDPFRLDRHPTMSSHPVTPMTESDLRLVLGTQTSIPVELIDVLKLEEQSFQPIACCTSSPPPIVLFDTLHPAHLQRIGRELDRASEQGPLFVVGSSAVEYALTAHWAGGQSQEIEGIQSGNALPFPASSQTPGSKTTDQSTAPAPVQLVVVSGSCSPVTDRQIRRAIEAGFAEIALAPNDLLQANPGIPELAKALDLVSGGRNLVIHTSRGPGDPRFQQSLTPLEREQLGWALGRLLDRLLAACGLKRAVVCGGDTSLSVARALGIESLEFAASAAPGSPLCLVHAPGRGADGCEIVFKGGQNGRDSLFLDVLDIPSRSEFRHPSTP